ncbi:MAG TPA: hypothetical protein VGO09_08270 [Flavisolibacter sp.]|nr:hypothetical protein [Flavisolibacter sp.]
MDKDFSSLSLEHLYQLYHIAETELSRELLNDPGSEQVKDKMAIVKKLSLELDKKRVIEIGSPPLRT